MDRKGGSGSRDARCISQGWMCLELLQMNINPWLEWTVWTFVTLRNSSTTSTKTLSNLLVRLFEEKKHIFVSNLKACWIMKQQIVRWGRRTTRHRGRLWRSFCSTCTPARTTATSSLAGRMSLRRWRSTSLGRAKRWMGRSKMNWCMQMYGSRS